jgi:hypothetical protein
MQKGVALEPPLFRWCAAPRPARRCFASPLSDPLRHSATSGSKLSLKGHSTGSVSDVGVARAIRLGIRAMVYFINHGRRGKLTLVVRPKISRRICCSSSVSFS